MRDIFQRFLGNRRYGEAFEALRILWDEEKDYESVLLFRRTVTDAVKNDGSKELASLVKKSWFISAQEKFRDYLICVEWDRPSTEKFFTPRACYIDRLGLVKGYQMLADGELDLLTNSLPKRAGKSQLEINFVNFMSGRRPNGSSLIEGAGDALVESFYKGCMEYLDKDSDYNYYDIFPNCKVVGTNAKMHTMNLNEESRFPTLMCRSIDATQVGLSEATNVMVLDDCIEGREEALNRARLDAKWDVVNGDVLGRALEGTPIVASGTRYSLYDVIGRLKEKGEASGWRMMCIEVPALDLITDTSNYEYYNPKLGRKIFTTDWFRQQRATLTKEAWESEFQQQPFEAKGLLFPEDDLNRFIELPVDIDPDYVMAVCDTAEGKGDSVAFPIGYVYGEDVYIVDVVFDDATPEHTKAEVANKIIEHRVGSATFESNSAGTYYARDVDEMVKKLGGKCSIKTKRTISNKETRIELASANILHHFYFLDKSKYEPNSQYGNFMREVTGYTRLGKVKHDDAPDSLSLFENEMRVVLVPTLEVKKRYF